MPMYTPIQDQSKWNGVVGIIPGELIQKYGSADGSTGTLYIVPLNKTLYITWYSVGGFRYTNTQAGYGLIVNSSNTPILRLGLPAGTLGVDTVMDVSLTIPLVALSGYKIQVVSDIGGYPAYMSFQGYLI